MGKIKRPNTRALRKETEMIKGSIICEPRFWLKWGVLLISWVSCVLILIIVSGNNELTTLYRDLASSMPFLQLPKNQIGAFNYRRWDPKKNYRPISSVRFENLCTENNKLGPFKTALHKVVKIRDLKLQFHRYSSDKVAEATTPDIFPAPKGTTTDTRALVKDFIDKLTTPTNGLRINTIDIGNVSEVRVDNLDYRVFDDGDLFFATESRRAIVSYKHSDVVLHGHAKITVADGSTLESNRIKWNTRRQHFSVDGVFVLNRGGMITTGKGICVDSQLQDVKGQYARHEQKEKECIAKL